MLNFTPQQVTIEFGDGHSLSVRGLNVPDLTQLIEVHQDAARELYDRVTGRDGEVITTFDAGSLAAALAATVPAMVAHTIALAADVPDRIEDVAKLPIDVQVAALEKIAGLTLAMSGGLGNFLEMVTRISAGANHLIETLKAPRQ